MNNANRPSKEQVRQWLQSRHNLRVPLPALDELRRQIGWSSCAGYPAPCTLKENGAKPR